MTGDIASVQGMTLTDPLLKDLKGQIGALVLSGYSGPYRDHEESVISLCLSLERIFSKGLIRHEGFALWKTDAFQWFYQLVRKYQRIIPLVFKVAFDEVLGNSKTKTSIGKTRLLIRTCLKRRCLFIPLHFHLENEDFNDTTLRINYDPQKSILGHEILAQIFLSLVQQLSHYSFDFDLCNAAFLDESWQLPVRIKTEIVPCEQLGLTLGFPLGFPLVVGILENSSAAEIHLIGVGDIVDEINGIFLRHYFGSKIDSLFRKVRAAPFTLTFIKGVNPQSGQVYLPIIKLYRTLGLDPQIIVGSRCKSPIFESFPTDDKEWTQSNVQIPNSASEFPSHADVEDPDLLVLRDNTDDERSCGMGGDATSHTQDAINSPAIFDLTQELTDTFGQFVFAKAITLANLSLDDQENSEVEEKGALLKAEMSKVEQMGSNITEPQKNDSSASALNLQTAQNQTDPLIV